MTRKRQPWTLQPPRLTDEAAIEIRDFLETFVLHFENHYGAQIRRYHANRSRENLRCARKATPWSSSDLVDDPPF